jgi:hypothetical protein
MMGMEMKDDAYVGIGFKYIKKTDFFSFEVPTIFYDRCMLINVKSDKYLMESGKNLLQLMINATLPQKNSINSIFQ